MFFVILKTFAIYSGALVVVSLILSTTLHLILDNTSNMAWISIPAQLITVFLAGYFGTKAFLKIPNIQKHLATPFWIGAWIFIVASLVMMLFYYLYFGTFLFSIPPLYILVSAFAGKIAEKSRR